MTATNQYYVEAAYQQTRQGVTPCDWRELLIRMRSHTNFRLGPGQNWLIIFSKMTRRYGGKPIRCLTHGSVVIQGRGAERPSLTHTRNGMGRVVMGLGNVLLGPPPPPVLGKEQRNYKNRQFLLERWPRRITPVRVQNQPWRPWSTSRGTSSVSCRPE